MKSTAAFYRPSYKELNDNNRLITIKKLFVRAGIYNWNEKYNFIKINDTYSIRCNCSIIDYIREFGHEECISLQIKKI